MEALEALGIRLDSLLWHTVNFLLLVWLLNRFLYRPVVRMLDERSSRIRESVEKAEQIERQLAAASEETRRQLETARKEGQAIVDQASQMADRMKAQAREEAQTEADKIVARARAQIEQEREQAMAELRREVANLVVATAAKVVGRSLDDRAQHRMIEEFIQSDSGELRN